LQDILGDKFIAAEGVESAVIRGTKPKPILDLILAIEHLEDWEWLKGPIVKLGYEVPRDLRQEKGRVLSVKGLQETRPHCPGITELNSDFWIGRILLRDYLTNSPQYRAEYRSLKAESFQAHNANREPYTRGREKLVRKTLKSAGYKGGLL